MYQQTDNDLLSADLCELVQDQDGLDVRRAPSSSSSASSRVSSSSSRTVEVEVISFEHEFANQAAFLEPALRSVKQAARDHLESILIKCKSEKEQALLLQQAQHEEELRRSAAAIESLKQQLHESEGRCDVMKGRWYLRSQQMANLIVSTNTRGCKDVKLMAKYFTAWKIRLSDERRLSQLEKLSDLFSDRLSKAQHFGVMARLFAKNRAERERDEYVAKLDSIARKTIGNYEIELETWRSRALTAEQRVESEYARRLKLEEDIKLLLLKNMASINLEALSVFHQHVFPEGEEEERSFFPHSSESATDKVFQLLGASFNGSASSVGTTGSGSGGRGRGGGGGGGSGSGRPLSQVNDEEEEGDRGVHTSSSDSASARGAAAAAAVEPSPAINLASRFSDILSSPAPTAQHRSRGHPITAEEKAEEALVLTKILQMQQASLRKEVHYSPSQGLPPDDQPHGVHLDTQTVTADGNRGRAGGGGGGGEEYYRRTEADEDDFGYGYGYGYGQGSSHTDMAIVGRGSDRRPVSNRHTTSSTTSASGPRLYSASYSETMSSLDTTDAPRRRAPIPLAVNVKPGGLHQGSTRGGGGGGGVRGASASTSTSTSTSSSHAVNRGGVEASVGLGRYEHRQTSSRQQQQQQQPSSVTQYRTR